MSGKKFLLDTNIVIGLFANDFSVIDHIESAKEIFIPVIVVGELYYGAEQSKHKSNNLFKIESFASVCVMLSCDKQTAKHYGIIKSQLKKKGTPIPENDIWIAALALQHKLTLATRDNHFNKINGLILENW